MVEDVNSVAHGITNYGMMAITAAFFLVLTGLLWVACFKWFKSIIDGMIKNNAKVNADLLAETRKQNEMLNDISEGLRPETLLKVKNLSSMCFDLAIERVCRIIKRVRDENHIADKVATVAKIRTLIENLHEDRNSRLDSFMYRGRTLSSYTNVQWIEWVAEVVEKEVYNEKINHGRAFTNVQAVYERIKIDYYHRVSHV